MEELAVDYCSRAKKVNINVIQCYAPTADKHELKEVQAYMKKNETTIILGDFNANVGKRL